MDRDVGPLGGTGGIHQDGSEKDELLYSRAEELPDYPTKKQVAAFFQVSESTIRNRYKPWSKGFCPRFPKPRRISYRLRWRKSQILAYAESSPECG